MIHFDRKYIDSLDKIFRLNLINSTSGFKSANLLGTLGEDGISNLGIFSSVTHYGSNPPILGFVVRPTKVPRHTYQNIKDTGYFTINHVNYDNVFQAHHCSAKYERTISEFDVTGLKEVYKDGFHAPYVDGAPVQLGMRFLEEVHIRANDTRLILGEIEQLYVQENILCKDGFLDLTKEEVMAISGSDAYVLPVLKMRFEYQRPGQETLEKVV